MTALLNRLHGSVKCAITFGDIAVSQAQPERIGDRWLEKVSISGYVKEKQGGQFVVTPMPVVTSALRRASR